MEAAARREPEGEGTRCDDHRGCHLRTESLVNRYPRGASVGWHNDAPIYETIIGISLGAPCTIQFRSKATEGRRVFERPLLPRSAYIMRDAARGDWQHRIPPTKSERFSLTLRSLSSVSRTPRRSR